MPDSDHVILVDERDAELGTAPKLDVHRPPGQLHRAISVFGVDRGGRLLLQRRAASKYHFPALWTNTCCSHPRPGETVEDTGTRRLREELGLCATARRVGSFVYTARDPASGLVERELDHVLVAEVNEDPVPDPAEVEAWRWISLADLRSELERTPPEFTPWLKPALECLLASGALDLQG